MKIPTQGTFLKKIHLILHRGFVESRQLALRQECRQLHDLADTFEVLPTLLEDAVATHLDRIRGILGHYQSKYRKTAYDYLSILEMSDDAFEETFRAREAF